jgi:hypothetical protein
MYCTRRFGLRQEFWERKGLSVASVQHAQGLTLGFQTFSANFSNKYNNFRSLLHAPGDVASDHLKGKKPHFQQILCSPIRVSHE